MAEKSARVGAPTGAGAQEDRVRLRGDEAELFERYHARLVASVGWSVSADEGLVEDACAFAWRQLIRCQPERTERIYAWLRKVAIREARLLHYRELREAAPRGSENPETDEAVEAVDLGELRAARLDCELAVEAREALRALAGLRPRERRYLTLQLAGLSYREIAERCGATYTNVNKHLARGRARLRALAESAEEVSPMAIGTCRTEGCEEPRRVRRGMIEPFCERCYWAARAGQPSAGRGGGRPVGRQALPELLAAR
ncbi:MAG: RNA polymerase sigma factor [Actinomycetota bacterium]|nr:RNA polymerase sigma factor [Actinomycetota bacterium]